MTPSEKEKIIKDSYEAIKDLYILRNELLTDAGKLEAARESNRKLSDRVANLEETIKILNSAIDKKDVEIKSLREELEAEKKSHCCDGYGSIRRIEALKKGCEENRKVAEKYKSEITEIESKFHELRQRLADMYITDILRGFSTSDFTEFAKWFTETFGDFGINDEEE